MKNWLKSNKWAIIFSTLGTLLPIAVGLLLWNQLPDIMNSHWGMDGVADGTAGKWVVVFVLPLILAAVNVLCFVGMSLDPKQSDKNKKAMGIVYWIMPTISMLASCSIYMAAMGKGLQIATITPLLLGLLFILIGNNLPKATQNRFYGIKLSWTLHNEENWNKTHRLAGKVWVVGGLLFLPTALLPLKWMIAAFFVLFLVMVLVPILYSYSIYKAHKGQGITYATPEAGKGEKVAKLGTIVGVIIVLSIAAVLMLTGDITYTFETDALRIEATFDGGMTIAYDAIDSLELQEDFAIGYRTFGFASAKLSMGSFSNDTLSDYTLYAYNACKSAVVIQSEGKWLVITAETPEETQALYQTLLEKTAK